MERQPLSLGIPFGVVMLIQYLRSGEMADALVSALCLSLYLACLYGIMRVPWAARLTKRTVITVLLVGACLMFWHNGGNLYANTIVGLLSIIAAGWLGWMTITATLAKRSMIYDP